MQSKTMMGGASEIHDRNHADFYPTPVECTVALLKRCPEFTNGLVWEPACGDGALSKVLEQHGAKVISTDLHDRGYGMAGINFLGFPAFPGTTSVVTNPPFNLAAEFIRHAATMRVPFAMLLKATYWQAASRLSLFRETGPKLILPMTWRPAFAPTRGKSPTMEFCWTVWGAEPSETCIFAPIPKPTRTEHV